MKNIYLERYATSKHYLANYEATHDLNLIVVIPCHDEPNLIRALKSLDDCEFDFPVVVITVINASEVAEESKIKRNEDSYREAQDWASTKTNSNIDFLFIQENCLPKKHAGVGLARKIGMDEAVRMFESIDNQNGIILCYDSDCVCLTNLLSEVNHHFEKNPKSPACSIHFEHPLKGEEDALVYEGIINYELHLRYYIDALKVAQFQYAHQTIGSSMAVRSDAYQKQGGMNKRKAGEDFYFLHKIMPLGNFTSLNSTMVIPSPRKSDRVPFGTGRAVGTWLESDKKTYHTYSFETFIDLKAFLRSSNNWIGKVQREALKIEFDLLPKSIQNFVPQEEFINKLQEINRQSTNAKSYNKRFFQWWDGFKVLKYVHYCRDNFYPNIDLSVALDWLFEQLNISKEKVTKDKLLKLRAHDKQDR